MSIHLTNTLKFPILRNVRASLLINSDIINDRLIYETILIFFDRESGNLERSIVDVSFQIRSCPQSSQNIGKIECSSFSVPGKRSCSISPRPQSLASKRACYDTSECRKSFRRVGVQSDIVTVNLTVVLDRVQRKGPRWVGKRDASLMAWKRLKRKREILSSRRKSERCARY